FASQGQTIDVNADQLDLQSVSIPVDVAVVMRGFFVGGAGSSFGLYNGAPASPPLYLVFPGAASSGWFASGSYRTGPARLVVNLFDNNANFVGSTTYLAGPPDPSDVGFYVQDGSSGATLYSQDARNTGGSARILMYAGTGAHVGETWFAAENGPG